MTEPIAPTEDKTPTDPRPPCPICGSTEHRAGAHEGAGPTGYHDNSEPTGYHDSSVVGEAEWTER
jgi:hypothetical protein